MTACCPCRLLRSVFSRTWVGSPSRRCLTACCPADSSPHNPAALLAPQPLLCVLHLNASNPPTDLPRPSPALAQHVALVAELSLHTCLLPQQSAELRVHLRLGQVALSWLHYCLLPCRHSTSTSSSTARPLINFAECCSEFLNPSPRPAIAQPCPNPHLGVVAHLSLHACGLCRLLSSASNRTCAWSLSSVDARLLPIQALRLKIQQHGSLLDPLCCVLLSNSSNPAPDLPSPSPALTHTWVW